MGVAGGCTRRVGGRVNCGTDFMSKRKRFFCPKCGELRVGPQGQVEHPGMDAHYAESILKNASKTHYTDEEKNFTDRPEITKKDITRAIKCLKKLKPRRPRGYELGKNVFIGKGLERELLKKYGINKTKKSS